MEQDLLQSIITTESEIQQAVESEKKKAAEWLETVRISLSRELEDKKKILEKEYKQALAATCKECRLKAQKEIAGAQMITENLQNLPEEIIRRVVRDILPKILPEDQQGETNDCQDVKS
jgi:hypothetical protein